MSKVLAKHPPPSYTPGDRSAFDWNATPANILLAFGDDKDLVDRMVDKYRVK
jgi:hypothetical protein